MQIEFAGVNLCMSKFGKYTHDLRAIQDVSCKKGITIFFSSIYARELLLTYVIYNIMLVKV